MSYPTDHNTATLDPAECEACRQREAQDAYRHGRVDNYYARFHLIAVAQDVKQGTRRRMEANRLLTHPSYPMDTRRNAAERIVRLTDLQYGWRHDDAR